jgi:hypothetical protein
MQLISKGQVSLSNKAQATVIPVPGPRQKKRKEPTCAGAVEDETACRHQTMTLTAERQRALLRALWFQLWGRSYKLGQPEARGLMYGPIVGAFRLIGCIMPHIHWWLPANIVSNKSPISSVSSPAIQRHDIPAGRIAIYRTPFYKSA